MILDINNLLVLEEVLESPDEISNLCVYCVLLMTSLQIFVFVTIDIVINRYCATNKTFCDLKKKHFIPSTSWTAKVKQTKNDV